MRADSHYQDSPRPQKRSRAEQPDLIDITTDSPDELSQDHASLEHRNRRLGLNGMNSLANPMGQTPGHIPLSAAKSVVSQNKSPFDDLEEFQSGAELEVIDNTAQTFTKNAKQERLGKLRLDQRDDARPSTRSSKAAAGSRVIVASSPTNETNESIREWGDPNNKHPHRDDKKASPDPLQISQSIFQGRSRKSPPVKRQDIYSDGVGQRFQLESIIHDDLVPFTRDYEVLVRDESFVIDLRDHRLESGVGPVVGPIKIQKIRRMWSGSKNCTMLLIEISRIGNGDTQFHFAFKSREMVENLEAILLRTDPTIKSGKKPDAFFDNFRLSDATVAHSRATTNHTQPATAQEEETSPYFDHLRDGRSGATEQRPVQTRKLATDKNSIPPQTVTPDYSRRTGVQVLDDVHNRHTIQSTRPNPVIQQHSPDRVLKDFKRLQDSGRPVRQTRASKKADRDESVYTEARPSKPKFSETGGLGTPWEAPLMYPSEGKKREVVNFADLHRFDEDEFLNDSIVAFFIRYLEVHLDKQKPDLLKKMHFFNSYFFETLTRTEKGKRGTINYDGVKKWTRNYDLFSRDFIVVPVNESLHWYVAIIWNLSYFKRKAHQPIEDEKPDEVVELSPSEADNSEKVQSEIAELNPQVLSDVRKAEQPRANEANFGDRQPQMEQPQSSPASTAGKRGRKKQPRRSLPKIPLDTPMIMTLDSLGTSRSATCSALREYIVKEALEKQGWEIDKNEIKGMTAKDIPMQGNYSDCGIYLCAYLERLVENPHALVQSILQREPQSWPEMESEVLRTRFRNLVMGLHQQQESKNPDHPIPEIGKILLHGPKPAPQVDRGVDAGHNDPSLIELNDLPDSPDLPPRAVAEPVMKQSPEYELEPGFADNQSAPDNLVDQSASNLSIIQGSGLLQAKPAMVHNGFLPSRKQSVRTSGRETLMIDDDIEQASPDRAEIMIMPSVERKNKQMASSKKNSNRALRSAKGHGSAAGIFYDLVQEKPKPTEEGPDEPMQRAGERFQSPEKGHIPVQTPRRRPHPIIDLSSDPHSALDGVNGEMKLDEHHLSADDFRDHNHDTTAHRSIIHSRNDTHDGLFNAVEELMQLDNTHAYPTRTQHQRTDEIPNSQSDVEVKRLQQSSPRRLRNESRLATPYRDTGEHAATETQSEVHVQGTPDMEQEWKDVVGLGKPRAKTSADPMDVDEWQGIDDADHAAQTTTTDADGDETMLV